MRRDCLNLWMMIVTFLIITVFTTVWEEKLTGSEKSLHAAQAAVAGKKDGNETLIIDIVPLLTPVATQFIVDPANMLQVFRYEPSRTAISEVRYGKLVDYAVITLLRSEFHDSANSTPKNPELLEDDQYRLLVCDSSQTCRSISGAVGHTTPAFREALDSLKVIADTIPVVRNVDAVSYLRCVRVPMEQWASIERRGTYELTEAEALPKAGRRAIKRAVTPIGRFYPLSALETEIVSLHISRSQVFIRDEKKIVGCELYSSVKE